MSTIRECYPVNGDWFCVTHQLGEERWTIERVILWALLDDKDRKVEHKIWAIVSYGGIPNLHEMTWYTYYVKGSDTSPLGKTWDEIYRSTTPTGARMVRDMTKLFDGLAVPFSDEETVPDRGDLN